MGGKVKKWEELDAERHQSSHMLVYRLIGSRCYVGLKHQEGGAHLKEGCHWKLVRTRRKPNGRAHK